MKRIHYLGALLVILATVWVIQAETNISGGGAIGNLWDTNGNLEIKTVATANAVDYLTATNAATANPATVAIGVAGSDSNINLNLVSKGSGTIQCNGSACGGSVTTVTAYMLPFAIPVEQSITATAVGAVNRVNVIRFSIPVQIIVNRVIWRNGTGSGNVGVAIYSADGSSRLLTTGGVAGATVNSVVISPGVTIGTGEYLLAWTADNTSNTFAVSDPGNTVTGINNTTVQQGYAANASSGGAPPSTTGALTGLAVGCLAAKLQN